MNVLAQEVTERFAIYNADTVEVARALPDNSVDMCVYSPPFASLFTYSASDRDMGNCADAEQFLEQYRFLLREQFRAMKPGRIVAVHCMQLTTTKSRDGEIGLRDFRGDIIREHIAAGFIYHSEIVVWKDPVTAMQRTKHVGLLWKTIKKDSAMSRQGLPDYIVIFRKPGTNPNPIPHTPEEFPVAQWQQWASPVWMDIDQGDTLNFRAAREEADERHMCALQLPVIERLVRLWSNPGDLIWSPFGGIGSEGYVALQNGRRAVLAELKESHYRQAVANLHAASSGQRQIGLFDEPAPIGGGLSAPPPLVCTAARCPCCRARDAADYCECVTGTTEPRACANCGTALVTVAEHRARIAAGQHIAAEVA